MAFLVALEEDLRDLDRLIAVLALVLRLVFLALLFGLAFLTLEFLAMVRVRVALLAERRRAGFSGVTTAVGAAADVEPGFPRLRPSPVDLASWERRSE